MSLDHLATQLALRGHLLTLSVCTTGDTSLAAVTAGYTRTSGSFLTDGFAVGMEVTPVGFASNPTGVVVNVSALALGIAGGRVADAEAASRSLTVGLPSARGWENVALEPTAGVPYIEEQYVPGSAALRSMPAAYGTLEDRGLYVVAWYGQEGAGLADLSRCSAAVLALFKPGTAFTIGTDTVVRVLEDPAPWRGQIRQDSPGWAVVVITVPWRAFSINT